MKSKIQFNIIEKNKYNDKAEISKFVNAIINKLIKNKYSKLYWLENYTHESCNLLQTIPRRRW